MIKKCSVCGGKYFARGLCSKHYYQLPEIKERHRTYNMRYRSRPEVKERLREYAKKYCSRPEVKKKQREYHSSPEVKKKQREYHSSPEFKKKQREYCSRPENRARWNKNKALRAEARVRELCLAHGFSAGTVEAMVSDGVILEAQLKELKKR